MSILDRTHSREYNCLHYAVEVWKDETGQDVSDFFVGAMAPRFEVSPRVFHGRQFQRLPAPASPCFVLFRRPKGATHIGVYTRGTVLHLTKAGAHRQLLPVAALSFKSVRFYAPR